MLATVNNKILLPTWANKTQCLAPFVFTTVYSEPLFRHTPLKATAPTTLSPLELFPKLWCVNNLQQNPLGWGIKMQIPGPGSLGAGGQESAF